MVAALGVLAGLAGAIYALQLTPTYTARATLLLDTSQQRVVDAEAVVQGLSGNEGAIRSEMELIRSYDVAKRVVQKLKLDQQSSTQPGVELRDRHHLLFCQSCPRCANREHLCQ
jgi:succinoglycan biosynthesis transport protein ExoP